MIKYSVKIVKKNAILRNLGLSFTAGMLFMVAQPVSAQEIAGVVTSVSGAWFVDGAKVKLGQTLSVGAVLKAKQPNAKYARVVVMLLDFKEVSRICDREGRCPDPLKLPAVVQRANQPVSLTNQRPTFWQRLVIAINKSREPRFRKTLVRSSGDLSDQVVKSVKGGIDLEPVFRNTIPGEFLVSVKALAGKADESPSLIMERQPIIWTGRGPLFVRASDLAPGLYQIAFAQPRGQRSVLPEDIWILVAEPSRYKTLSTEYEMAKSTLAGWDRKGRPQAEDVLRAFLADLQIDGMR